MADDPLRAALLQRRDEIRDKIAKRKNQPGFAQNVELMESLANELDRMLAASPPEGDE